MEIELGKRVSILYEMLCGMLDVEANGVDEWRGSLFQVSVNLLKHNKYFRDEDTLRAALTKIEVYHAAGLAQGRWVMTTVMVRLPRLRHNNHYEYVFRRAKV